MKDKLVTFVKSLWNRVLDTFGDTTPWLLALPSGLILLLLDVAKLLTLLEWMLYAAIIAGFAVQISRTVFPQIEFTAMVKKALEDARASATVSSAIILFVGLLVFSLALWTKP